MVNYLNGKIYRIVCNETGKCYVGSTTTALSTRLCQHKKIFKDNKSGTSKQVLQNGNYNIILLEDFPCERKEQLLQRERYYIEKMDCVNKKIPLRSAHDWYEDNKEQYIERQMVWNNNNKDKLKEYQKTFKAKQPSDIVLKASKMQKQGADLSYAPLVTTFLSNEEIQQLDIEDVNNIVLNIEDIYDCEKINEYIQQEKDTLYELIDGKVNNYIL